MTETTKKQARCYLCKKRVDDEDSYCYGCDQHICDECDLSSPMGVHEPRDHSKEAEDE